jgi:6-phosphogluconolactonase
MSIIIKTGDNPGQQLAEDLSTWIRSSNSEKMVCFCAGGSALSIYNSITDELVKRRTIFMMGDERVSREPSINNHEQLKARLGSTYQSFRIIDSSFYDETSEAYVDRLNQEVKNFLHDKFTIVCILGIGEDGHTAGIFPLDKELFQAEYPDEGMYVPVHIEGLTIDSRASLTPTFIESNAQAIFAYATGEKKRPVIERLKEATEETPINELPAAILHRIKDAALYTDISVD